MYRTTPFPARSADGLVTEAARRWINLLTDLSAGNNLLYYRDLKSGTLDFAEADDKQLQRLLDQNTVRCSRLFPGHAPAAARLGSIYRNVRKLDEEYGISTGYLAIGMASWREDRKSPAAPIVLRPLSLRPTSPARDDFELTLDEGFVINPVLLRKLNNDFQVSISAAELESLVDEDPFDPAPACEQLRTLAAGVPGFAVTPRLVAGTFSYAKLPMVEDLRMAADLLAGNHVVSALAGDPRAIDTDAAGDGIAGERRRPVRPEREFLVLDADSSQTAAINAVLAGRDLVIQGPPGTGKSQTIANAIAALTAAGKRVLFVAEKRAAIDAVLKYLNKAQLGALVLDIHDGVRAKRTIAEALKAALDAVGQVTEPDLGELHRRLAARREQIDEHSAAMNEIRAPWGVSFFDAQAEFETIPEPLRSAARIRGGALTALAGAARDRARDELQEAARIRRSLHSPWAGASISSREAAQDASDLARELSTRLLPDGLDQLRAICAELSIPQPLGYQDWTRLYRLLDGVAGTCRVLGDDVFAADLPSLVAATARRADRRASGGPPLSWSVRRALRRQARNRWRGSEPGRAQLHDALARAEHLAAAWRQAGYDGGPATCSGWAAAAAGFAEVETCVGRLDGLLAGARLTRAPLDQLRLTADRLAARAQDPWHVARLAELHDSLAAAGLSGLVAEISRRDADQDQAVRAFDSSWYASIVEHVRRTDPHCDATRGPGLSQAVADFQQYDTAHLARNADRIRRTAARRARDAQDAHPDQASLVSKEAGKARRHLPLRDLLGQAPDVMLALKPCWAISPIVVSQVLPLRELFDVVIFDEASQIRQADAVPSIIRARQVVVTGDTKQLTPTDFFSSVIGGEDDEYGTAGAAGGAGAVDGTFLARTGSEFESILDSLATLLPVAQLTWHYRSRDERLIAFSNQHFYRSSMTTFPGVGADECLTHVVAKPGQAVTGQEQSAAAEVERVVELIIEHAATRPAESLGVITLGSTHQLRIEAKLRSVLQTRADLAGFFSPDGEEPFFIKNLERVQGDERDAIILSVGYGKKADGRMQYNWGPLTHLGGERRLNVAVTRAKTRLTLVTSFRTEEVDPSRFTYDGGKLLSAYLAYVDSGGCDPGSVRDGTPDLNPFERDVSERLRAAGIPVVPQYGVGGMRIDFAARHPLLPGRMVLAIEADGASYHSSGKARDRDRLRQEHLRRLGWRFHRIWSTDWFADPDSEIAKIRAAYEQSVADSDQDEHRPGEPGATVPPPRRPGAAGHRPPRPWVQPGLPIDDYSEAELGALARWIESDGRLRTEEGVAEAMRAALGFSRRGSKIDRRLHGAITAARATGAATGTAREGSR